MPVIEQSDDWVMLPIMNMGSEIMGLESVMWLGLCSPWEENPNLNPDCSTLTLTLTLTLM